MAQIDNWRLNPTGSELRRLGFSNNQMVGARAWEELARFSFKREAWRWFEEHQEQVIAEVGIWIFTRTFRLNDIRHVWRMIFGPEPIAETQVSP